MHHDFCVLLGVCGDEDSHGGDKRMATVTRDNHGDDRGMAVVTRRTAMVLTKL